MPASNVRLLTIDQVAERLSVTRRHVYRLIHDGELSTIDVARPGARALQRIREDELHSFMFRRAG